MESNCTVVPRIGEVLEVGKFVFDTANSANEHILEKIKARGLYLFCLE